MRLPAFSLYPAPQPPTQADRSTGDTNGWVNRVSPPGWGRRDCLFSHVETSPVHLLLTPGPAALLPALRLWFTRVCTGVGRLSSRSGCQSLAFRPWASLFVLNLNPSSVAVGGDISYPDRYSGWLGAMNEATYGELPPTGKSHT